MNLQKNHLQLEHTSFSHESIFQAMAKLLVTIISCEAYSKVPASVTVPPQSLLHVKDRFFMFFKIFSSYPHLKSLKYLPVYLDLNPGTLYTFDKVLTV